MNDRRSMVSGRGEWYLVNIRTGRARRDVPRTDRTRRFRASRIGAPEALRHRTIVALADDFHPEVQQVDFSIAGAVHPLGGRLAAGVKAHSPDGVESVGSQRVASVAVHVLCIRGGG